MKLNPKIYKTISGEPFKTQEINGVKVEFFYMEETPFFSQYAGKGRFALWTSDGKDYRVLVEKTYYEALERFYDEPINAIWINFLHKIGKISNKMSLFFTVPMILIYIIIAAIATIYFQEQLLLTLLIMVIIVIGSNMFRATLVNRKAHAENRLAQEEIRNYLGEESFSEMVKKQEEHYKMYFKFDEEETNEETTDEDTHQVIENEKEKGEDDE